MAPRLLAMTQPAAATTEAGGSAAGPTAPLLTASHERHSFAAQRRLSGARRDAPALALFCIINLLPAFQLRSLYSSQELTTAAYADVAILAALGWAVLAPTSYNRCRNSTALLLRALIIARIMLVDSKLSMPSGARAVDAPRFVVALMRASGFLPLMQAALGLELPPLTCAVVQAASVLLASTRNPAICATSYLRHPESRRLLSAAFRVAQPAVALLEPILTLAGVHRRTRQDRQCICVLSVLQFWGALALPMLVIWRRQLSGYWEMRRQQLQQWARQQLIAQPLTPPSPSQRRSSSSGSVRRRRLGHARPAGSSGGRRGSGRRTGSKRSSGSSSGTSGSSGQNSLSRSSPTSINTEWQPSGSDELAALLRRSSGSSPRQLVPPHPQDWQYEAASRLYRELRPGWKHVALLVFIAAHLYTWHVMLYPADEGELAAAGRV